MFGSKRRQTLILITLLAAPERGLMSLEILGLIGGIGPGFYAALDKLEEKRFITPFITAAGTLPYYKLTVEGQSHIMRRMGFYDGIF